MILTGSLVTYIVVISVIALLLKFIKRYYDLAEWRRIPSATGTVPIFGNSLQFVLGGNEGMLRGIVKCCDHKHPLTRLDLVNEKWVLCYKSAAVEVMLSHKHNIEKSWDYKFLYPWLGTGLLTSTDSKWFHRRKLLTPAFHFKILEEFLEIFNSQSQIFIDKLKEEIYNNNGFDIANYVSLCTLDIICETAMGTKLNAQSNKDSPYVRAVKKISEILHRRTFHFWKQIEFIFNFSQDGRDQKKCLDILHGFTNRVIRERKVERRMISMNRKEDAKKSVDADIYGGKKKRVMAFLDLLLEVAEIDGTLDDEGIREEVDTFMFEGHDTTSVGLSWVIYLLGLNPQCQKLAQDELDLIFGDSDRPATTSDLSQMKYLEQCIKESLRLYPSVPMMGRTVSETMKIGDFTIHPGIMVSVLPYVLHRDPEVFPDPEKFDPNRFLPENAQNRNPYSYVPFSAGSRNCIGQKFALMEEKIVLSTFLRNYNVKSLVAREDIVLLAELVLKSKDPLLISITPR